MKELREIGIEKECFLLHKGEVMQPKKYGFPYDEMGFLVELRSWQSERLEPIEMSLNLEWIRFKHRADKFGMALSDNPYMNCSKKFVDDIEDTYHISEFPDNTKNIYNDGWHKGDMELGKLSSFLTHHTGILPEKGVKDCYRLTSGIHVHFSSRNKKTGEVIGLPVEDIVRQMDKAFKDNISDTGRIKGEYELKEHGFEYRSLPCNTDIHKILKESFRILRKV